MNIASYAVRIVLHTVYDTNVELSNVGSGIAYPAELKFILIDFDNQTMILINSTQIKIFPLTPLASISGISEVKIDSGVATFTNVIFESQPGTRNIVYKLNSELVDSKKVTHLELPTNNTITVNFRYCKPGEFVQEDGTCKECSAGTYSLNWNSTECMF